MTLTTNEKWALGIGITALAGTILYILSNKNEKPINPLAPRTVSTSNTCQCLVCGHTFTGCTKDHCDECPCPVCGSPSRRIDRPGIGKELSGSTNPGWRY